MTKYIVTGGAEIEHRDLHFDDVEVIDLREREEVAEFHKRTGTALTGIEKLIKKTASTKALAGVLAYPANSGSTREQDHKNREARNMMREELAKRLCIGEDSP